MCFLMHFIALELALSIINLTSRNELLPSYEFSFNINSEIYPDFYAVLRLTFIYAAVLFRVANSWKCVLESL